MGKSIDEVYRKIIENQRLKIESDRLKELTKLEELKKQSDWFRTQNRMYEYVGFAPGASSPAGGGGGRVSNESLGNDGLVYTSESVMHIFNYDGDLKYYITNFTNDIDPSGVKSFGLSNDHSIIDIFPLTNNSFCVIFYINEECKIRFISVDGTIIYEKSIYSPYNSHLMIEKLCLTYQESDMYKLLILDHNGVHRIINFTYEISFSHEVDANMKYGFVVISNDGLNNIELFYIKNDSTTPISIGGYSSENYRSEIYHNRNSDVIIYLIVDINSSYYISLHVVDKDGIEILNYDLTNISPVLYDNSEYSFINTKGSFVFLGIDDPNSRRYIIYYNVYTNQLDYKFVDISYNYNFRGDYSNVTTVDSYNYDSVVLIFYDTYNNIDGYNHSDNIIILQIFEDDISLRDFYVYATPEDNREKGLYPNRILGSNIGTNILLTTNINNTNFEILKLSKNDPPVYIDYGINRNNHIYGTLSLYDRYIVRFTDAEDVSLQRLISINTNGTYTSELVIGDYGYELVRNTIYIKSNVVNKGWYSNSTNRDFVEIEKYDEVKRGDQYIIEDNILNGILLVYDTSSGDVRVITDTTISDVFNLSLSNDPIASLTKHEVFINNKNIAITKSIMSSGLYKFSDEGSNYIQDGGGDMYDEGNKLYVNDNQVNYTHTQLSGQNVPDNEYPKDGQIISDIFGEGSQYFTNLYPGLFVMAGKNISINKFKIDGGNGADGSGSVDNHQYTTTYGGNQYTVFMKNIYNANMDPSINHMIIVNGDGFGITQSISSNTNNDTHQLEGLDSISEIHYLLMSKSVGSRISNEEMQSIVEQYLSLVESQDISNTLLSLNNYYESITGLIDYTNGYNSLTFADFDGNPLYTYTDEFALSESHQIVGDRMNFIFTNNVLITLVDNVANEVLIEGLNNSLQITVNDLYVWD